MPDPRYDLFGWDYALQSPLTDAEVQWHLRWAERTGGPFEDAHGRAVLGLACGTGRLLCRMAEAGFNVTGLDNSDTMLSSAADQRAKLAPAARRRVRFVKGDMSAFDLGQQFGTVLIADNSFRSASTRRELRSCLRCIQRHLAPGGRLLITERHFRPEWYPNGVRCFGWSDPMAHPQTGELVSRRGEIRLIQNGKRLSGTFIYRTAHADGTITEQPCPWSAPLLQRDEYLALFAAAGFETQVFADYQEKPDDEHTDLFCFVCTKRVRLLGVRGR